MASSLPVSDTTVQETNAWLKAATAQTLRDRQAPDPAMNFTAELPLPPRVLWPLTLAAL